MNANHQLFQRDLYRARRDKSGAQFAKHDFLHRIAEDRAMERLDAMDRTFERALVIGAATDALAHHPKLKQCVFADMAASRVPDNVTSYVLDEEALPVAHQSLDVVISLLSLHAINDVPGALIQMQRALKADGLLLVITAGAHSLHELRDSLAQTEARLYGGISPRVSPFMEVRDAGGLLQRAGFHLPVVDNERLMLSYENLHGLMRELRGAGEANHLHDRVSSLTSRHFFDAVDAYYSQYYGDDEGRIACTAELLTLTAWTPHASQQQPAKRGSGKVNLVDFLGDE